MTSSVATRSSWILSRIRSLTDRKTAKRSSSVPPALEGSSKDQCSLLWAPGKNGHASLASSQTVITWSKGSLRYLSRVLDTCPEMSTPISSIALTARGLTWVASVPALIASKRSPARCLKRPSAIWLLAELWVHRNRTLARSPASAAATRHAPLGGVREQVVGGLAKQPARGIPVEGVEGPLPVPLLCNQPGVLELLHVVGDLRLAHREGLLELADADALLPLFDRHAGVGEVAAATALGHHGKHPHPYGVGQRAAHGHEPLNPHILGAALAGAVLLDDPELLGAHDALPTGLRPRTKALASGTSAAAVVAAVVAVSPQQPEPPPQPEASENSSSYVWVTSTETSSKPASESIRSYSSLWRAPETHPDHASMLFTSSSGSLPLSPRNTMSETAKRPPGFRTRNASEITPGLSVERLMTQLEITTST